MTRKELYQKITELNLQEEVKKACGRNFTQAPNSVLIEIVGKAEVKSKVPKKPEVSEAPAENPKCECQDKKQSSDETKLDKLIKVLTKKRILLDSEIEFILK